MGKWFKVHSVSSAIGRSMVLILFMASLIAVVAMVTLFYSVPDAKAINLSGSLRMQAYRMAYEIEKDQAVLGRLDQFEQTLHASELQETQRWITPASLRRTYGEVLLQWQMMREHIENATPSRYTDNTEQFVAAIDDFVNQMQYHVEFKVRMLALAEGWACSPSSPSPGSRCVSPASRWLPPQSAGPLRTPDPAPGVRPDPAPTAKTSWGNCPAPSPPWRTSSASSIGSWRARWKKTAKLQQANDTLSFLYSTAQKLHAAPLSRRTLQKLLERAAAHQHIDYIRLTRFEHNAMPVYITGRKGWPGDLDAVVSFYLQMDDEEYGRLDMISAHPIDERLMKNFSMLLAQVLHKDQTLLQHQRLLLMEERAVIARELHDSLAQALSYLKIQSTLLKRSVAKGDNGKAKAAMEQIDEGLSNAYTQLRELLGTFRLSIGDANLGEAIGVMLEQLKPQTRAEIRLQYGLTDTDLEAGSTYTSCN